MANSIEQELLLLKEKIDNRKTDKAKLTGELESHYNRLKEEFGCNTLDEANTYLEELAEERDELKLQLDNGIEEIKLQLQGVE
jgi:hypothetical protein